MSEMIVQVRNKMLRRIGGVNHFVSHNKDYTIQFQFDESWNNVRTKMAVFAYEDGEYGSEIFDGDTCNVPELPREGRILIGVKAGEDLSTELLCIPVCKSADDVITDEYDEPDPKIYEQILDIINNLWNGGTTVYPSPVKFLASPSTAKVGDLIRVKEVDENGDVTRTEGFDVGVELEKKIDAPQVAQVGEVLTVEAVDAEGKPTKWKTAPAAAEQKQADWNQNDETAADYVKNRTHYTNIDTVLEYGALNGFKEEGEIGAYYYDLPYVLDIYDGLKVEVTWDNQVYQLTAIQPIDGIVFIGNNAFLGGEDSGEPFGIVINKPQGKTSVYSTDTETSHEVGIVAKTPVRIEPYFLPSNIAYLQDGFIPLNLVIPNVEDVFGGPIYAGGTESTLENPYRNKHTLNNLTLETFNKMLVGTVYLPRSVFVDDKNIASVSVFKNNGYIRVLWSSNTTYSIQGYGLAGARIEIYDARIHEDAGNPGTIVSEYAMIFVANKQLT